jgi:glucokinase
MAMRGDLVIGVDLGGTKVRVGAVRGAELCRDHTRRISSRATEAVVLDEVFEAIDRVHSREARAIGCGVPSLVDVERGIVHRVENIPSWREVPLKEILERRYGVPVFVNNDANCFALGEHTFGKGAAYRNLVGVTIGTGLGVGLILDGRLYSGTNCGAGEVGAIPFREHTLEYFCSGVRLFRETGLPGEVICERAAKGDAEALAAFEALGSDLGAAVSILLYAFDPQIIVFGGSVSAALPFCMPALRRELARFPQPHVVDGLVLERSELPEAALLGAAALCAEELGPAAGKATA